MFCIQGEYAGNVGEHRRQDKPDAEAEGGGRGREMTADQVESFISSGDEGFCFLCYFVYNFLGSGGWDLFAQLPRGHGGTF